MGIGVRRRSSGRMIIWTGCLSLLLCVAGWTVSAEPDRLFFGDWFYFFGGMAYGESLEPPTSRIDVKSGSITWVDEFGELFFRAQFEVIEDFGDHLVIKIEMRLAGDPGNPVIEIQTLALLPDDPGQFPTFDGRPMIHLNLTGCGYFEGRAFAEHVLKAGTGEDVWEEILRTSQEEDSSWEYCIMTADGYWKFDRPTMFNSFSRFSDTEEQQYLKNLGKK